MRAVGDRRDRALAHAVAPLCDRGRARRGAALLRGSRGRGCASPPATRRPRRRLKRSHGGLLVGAAGAALWATSAAPSKPQPIPAVTMPSLEELHARADLQSLPVQEVKEPF